MSGALRILVAHNIRRDRPGGMNRIMERIHGHVAQAGHTVEYLCAEDVPESARGRFGRFLFPLAVRRRVLAAIRSGRPYDVINVHEPSGAVITALRPPVGVVAVTSHGVEHRAWDLALEERRLGRDGPGWKTRVVYPLTTLWQADASLRRADHVFCLSTQDSEYLTARLGVAPGNITRMFPAADPVFATAAANRDYGRVQRVLFAGTWRKNKGTEDLVPAFNLLASRHPALELVVLGAGVEPTVVRGVFAEAVRSRVTCVETTNDGETARHFSGADVFVLPSLFEGTPLTLLEAMMSGLPIVTTDTCGMRDVIRHDGTGRLIPMRSPDAIVAEVERLLASAGDRARLGRAAQTEAKDRYTWNRVAEPVRHTYERLCGGRH